MEFLLALLQLIPMHTGVDWCELTVSDAALEIVGTLRESEGHVAKTLASSGSELVVRQVAVNGVDAAEALGLTGCIATEELFDRCFAMRGKPWDQARMRRDMRERIRLHRALEEGAPVPTDAAGLIALWSRATKGDAAWYSEAEKPQFRVKGIPFGHGENTFEEAPAPKCKETVAAADIPREVEALLAFIRYDDLPLEVRSACAHFLLGHIHPFRDGNGHTARMLTCLMLAEGYSEATLLCLMRRLQLERMGMSAVMDDIVAKRRDMAEVLLNTLELMSEAQRDVMRIASDKTNIFSAY